jgi:hypothetical protein
MKLDRGRPEILTPPGHPPACCHQQTITVPPQVAAKTRQKHDYPSLAHRRSYARRTGAERTFGRVAPARCRAEAPSGPCMRVVRAHGPGKSPGWFRSSAARRCRPPAGPVLHPVAGGVHEVRPAPSRGGGRGVVDQVVRLDRFPGDPQEPTLPALRGLGRLVGGQQVLPAQTAAAVLPGEQAHGVVIQRGRHLPAALRPVSGQVRVIG